MQYTVQEQCEQAEKKIPFFLDLNIYWREINNKKKAKQRVSNIFKCHKNKSINKAK